MNKVYFLIPVIGLLLFGGYWYSFSTAYDKRIEAQQAAAVQARVDREHLDQINRQKAYDEATAVNQARTKLRDDKKAKETKEKADREAAIDLRSKSLSESFKFASQAERLAKDLAALIEENARVEDRVSHLKAEQEFLKVYVQKTEENVKSISAVAEKIEKSDETITRTAKELSALKTKTT
jgi:uncharacterized protein (DUF3084 family)